MTTVIDFADDDKKSLVSSFKSRADAMGADMSIDFAIHQGVYAFREGLYDELKAVRDAGCRAIKLFTTYRDAGYLIEKREELKEIFSMCADLGLMVCVHCEDDEFLASMLPLRLPTKVTTEPLTILSSVRHMQRLLRLRRSVSLPWRQEHSFTLSTFPARKALRLSAG